MDMSDEVDLECDTRGYRNVRDGGMQGVQFSHR